MPEGLAGAVLAVSARSVADRVLDEEERERHHLVVALSGAHAYGFPSPDSDLDLKAIHVAPTARFLGFSAAATTVGDRLETIDGVEIDYSSNEIQPALIGMLNGNGNFLERVLGKLILRTSPAHVSLAPLAQLALSRRVHRHYRGFAAAMLREFTSAAAPTAKKILYVLRTALTGTHLLATGALVTDVTLLLDRYGFADARDLVDAKRAGERAVLSEDARTRWIGNVDRAFAALDQAYATSSLPDEPPNRDELEDWLIDLRRARLQDGG